ncbi:MAG: hypothetical protein B7Z15_03885 [Rhizobiales bacterium 32-66-8]|nr:MAG: hypothetical protein B7Z15_03885 [Rhizobiales bacterium 32-66-8]
MSFRFSFGAARAAALAGSLLALSAVMPAQAQQPTPIPNTVSVIDIPGVGPMNMLTYRAQFVSADPATRRVVLQGSNGKRWSVLVPPLLGDVMLLANSQSLTIRVLPGVATYLGKAHQGTPGVVVDELVLKAGLPGWPEDFGFREVSITAILVNIDKVGGTLSFEGVEGLVRTVKVVDPTVLADLQKVQIGDLSQIKYYEGLAITANR